MALPLKYDPLWPEDEDEFNYEVKLYDERIAFLYTSRTGEKLRLQDVRVEEEPRGRGRWHHRLLHPTEQWPPKLRGRGIGTNLLRLLIEWADEKDVPEIWGEVTLSALKENRDLLGWYNRHGFEIQKPDAECEHVDAAKKIVRIRP